MKGKSDETFNSLFWTDAKVSESLKGARWLKLDAESSKSTTLSCKAMNQQPYLQALPFIPTVNTSFLQQH